MLRKKDLLLQAALLQCIARNTHPPAGTHAHGELPSPAMSRSPTSFPQLPRLSRPSCPPRAAHPPEAPPLPPLLAPPLVGLHGHRSTWLNPILPARRCPQPNGPSQPCTASALPLIRHTSVRLRRCRPHPPHPHLQRTQVGRPSLSLAPVSSPYPRGHHQSPYVYAPLLPRGPLPPRPPTSTCAPARQGGRRLQRKPRHPLSPFPPPCTWPPPQALQVHAVAWWRGGDWAVWWWGRVG